MNKAVEAYKIVLCREKMHWTNDSYIFYASVIFKFLKLWTTQELDKNYLSVPASFWPYAVANITYPKILEAKKLPWPLMN